MRTRPPRRARAPGCHVHCDATQALAAWREQAWGSALRTLAVCDWLDTWPEAQPGHHYDGLSALAILWMIAHSRAVGTEGFRSIGRHGSCGRAGDFSADFNAGASRRMF